MIEKFIDKYNKEEDLICVSIDEIEEDSPYYMDKHEIIRMLLYNSVYNYKKIKENCILIKQTSCEYINADMYLICPLKANSIIKKSWNDIIKLLTYTK